MYLFSSPSRSRGCRVTLGCFAGSVHGRFVAPRARRAGFDPGRFAPQGRYQGPGPARSAAQIKSRSVAINGCLSAVGQLRTAATGFATSLSVPLL